MAQPTTITIKFKKPIAIGLPSLGTLAPNLYATTRVVNGFSSPVPVQDYKLDEDEYEVNLLSETPDPLPAHLQDLDPGVKQAFQTSQATGLAANHNANNLTRDALKKYEDEGYIEIVHDTFKDGPKEKKGNGDPGQWLLQDQNQGKRLDENSLDSKNDREKRASDPNPHVPRAAVGSDANHQATTERNAEFGDHEGVPTNLDPKPQTLKQKAAAKQTKNPTSTELKAGSGSIANTQNTEGGEASPTVATEADKV